MNAKGIVLHLAKGMGLFALFRALTRNSPRILCYHGGSLGDEHLFNPKLFCRPALLDERLHWLKSKGFVPSSLNAILEPGTTLAAEGTPVIVTLDDGWYSTTTELLPVLARHQHKPVLYLATKMFTNGCPVVDVCIRYILWKSPIKDVRIEDFHIDLDGNYDLRKKADRELLCNAAERWLSSFDGNAAKSHAALQRLADALGVPSDTLNLNSRRFSFANAGELTLAAQNGCQIEMHGHVHKYLRGQTEQNRVDIETCRQHIVELGLLPPRHYCYPSGEYDDQAPAMMLSAGISSATTCISGLVHSVAGTKRYFLPRFLDGEDVAMIEFEAEMSGVLEFLRGIIRR